MELEQIFQKLYMEPQKAPHSKGILRKNKAGGIVLHIIKLYYKVIVIKTAWYWQNDRHINQWNKIESPEINPSLYSQLILNRESKHTQWAKIVYSINDVGKIGLICACLLYTSDAADETSTV